MQIVIQYHDSRQCQTLQECTMYLELYHIGLDRQIRVIMRGRGCASNLNLDGHFSCFGLFRLFGSRERCVMRPAVVLIPFIKSIGSLLWY